MRTEALLMSALLAASFSCSGEDRQPSAEITDINGVDITDKSKVQDVGGGIRVLPSTDWDGPVPVGEGDNTERKLVAESIYDPARLKKWGMCAAELANESRHWTAQAEAIEHFPDNKPFANTTDPNEREHDAKQLVAHKERASLFASAAKAAEAYDIPCVSDGDGYAARYSTFEVTVGGQQRTVRIPDFSVLGMSMPLEYVVADQPCPSYFDDKAAEVSAKDIDATVQPRPEKAAGPNEWYTFDERDRYTAAAEYASTADALRAIGKDC